MTPVFSIVDLYPSLLANEVGIKIYLKGFIQGLHNITNYAGEDAVAGGLTCQCGG